MGQRTRYVGPWGKRGSSSRKQLIENIIKCDAVFTFFPHESYPLSHTLSLSLVDMLEYGGTYAKREVKVVIATPGIPFQENEGVKR